MLRQSRRVGASRRTASAVGAASSAQRHQMLAAAQNLPHRRRQPESQHAQNQPASRCRPAPGDHAAGQQAADDNARAGTGVNQPTHRRNAQPGQPRQTPARGIDKHQRARHASGKAQRGPGGRHGPGHRQRQQPGGGQSGAHQPDIGQRRRRPETRPQPRLQRAKQSAQHVTQVIGAGQPAGAGQIDHPVVQHHRQQRREGKAANAHRHRQRHQPGQRNGARTASGCGLSGRIFL